MLYFSFEGTSDVSQAKGSCSWPHQKILSELVITSERVLGLSRITNLEDLACCLLITPKGRPASAIELDKCQLQLSAHDF